TPGTFLCGLRIARRRHLSSACRADDAANVSTGGGDVRRAGCAPAAAPLSSRVSDGASLFGRRGRGGLPVLGPPPRLYADRLGAVAPAKHAGRSADEAARRRQA